VNDAFDLMLGVFRSPARTSALRTRELPADVLDVIRIAAGDDKALAAARSAILLDDADLHVAANLVLHNMLFFDGADYYRTLGVRPDADAAQIKRHYRWLVRWLHPDRHPDEAHGAFVDRINRAWNAIRTEERRANYDRGRQAATAAAAAGQPLDTSALLREWAGRPSQPWLSARLVRRLPKIVVAGAGAIALTVLGLALWIRSFDAGDAVALSASPVAGAIDMPSPPMSAPPPIAAPRPVVPAPAFEPAAIPRIETAAMRDAPERDIAPTAAPPRRVASREVAPPPAGTVPVVNAPVAPVASAEPAPAQRAEPALSAGDLRDFVERFERLYEADDVDRFLALFSTRARGNDGGHAELVADYRRLFEQRRQRWLRLSDVRWQVDGTHAAGSGSYAAWVGASAGKPASQTRGRIQLQLARDADGVRIVRLQHSVNE
jgi:hypothetical protein